MSSVSSATESGRVGDREQFAADAHHRKRPDFQVQIGGEVGGRSNQEIVNLDRHRSSCWKYSSPLFENIFERDRARTETNNRVRAKTLQKHHSGWPEGPSMVLSRKGRRCEFNALAPQPKRLNSGPTPIRPNPRQLLLLCQVMVDILRADLRPPLGKFFA